MGISFSLPGTCLCGRKDEDAYLEIQKTDDSSDLWDKSETPINIQLLKSNGKKEGNLQADEISSECLQKGLKEVPLVGESKKGNLSH